jgi:hypothetical protein
MDIKKTYQDMLTSLRTDDAKEAWEALTDKKSREAAEFIYKVVKAYESIRDEIRQDTSMTARYPEYRFQTRNENYDYVEDVGNSYIIEVYFYESNKVVAKNIYFCDKEWFLSNDIIDQMYKYAFSEISEFTGGLEEEIIKKERERATIDREMTVLERTRTYSLRIKELLLTETGTEEDIRLRNRYAGDVRLRAMGSRTKWKLVVPPDDYQYIGLNYDGTPEEPHYVSIDPPGGPYLYLGENKIVPYMSQKEITIKINRIYEEKGDWILETDEVPEI